MIDSIAWSLKIFYTNTVVVFFSKNDKYFTGFKQYQNKVLCG